MTHRLQAHASGARRGSGHSCSPQQRVAAVVTTAAGPHAGVTAAGKRRHDGVACSSCAWVPSQPSIHGCSRAELCNGHVCFTEYLEHPKYIRRYTIIKISSAEACQTIRQDSRLYRSLERRRPYERRGSRSRPGGGPLVTIACASSAAALPKSPPSSSPSAPRLASHTAEPYRAAGRSGSHRAWRAARTAR